jgi:hypothetical protein
MNLDQQFIEAFALQYHGIRCMQIEGYPKLSSPYACLHIIRKNNSMLEYIELRSIDSLTREEKELFIKEDDYGNNKDFCRQIGIAVSFRGVSVDEMIEQGILKLKI